MPAHVHLKVANIAKEMAGELYETMMGDNEWYDSWKKRWPNFNSRKLEAKFIEKNWPRLVGQARATLAGMLTNPAYPEGMKEDIFTALCQDSSLKLGRGRLSPGTRILQ
ncbi:MAG TPA: hypothetical protein VJQ25_05945 [Nitrospira sp.]|nr:hypothetical protein [Nitrospira sp.]